MSFLHATARAAADGRLEILHATRRRLPGVLPAALLAAAGALGCASKQDEPEGIPHDPNVIRVQKEELKAGPMGPLLASLDSEVRAWTSLTLSADTDQRKRQARILEQSLRYQAQLRLDDLIAELESDATYNRMVAAVVLGFADHDKALGPLVAALDDPSTDVQSNALLGLAILSHRDTPPGPIEEQLLHSTNSSARGNAALCLRKIIEAGATVDGASRAGRAGLIDSEPSVRAQCAMLLAYQLDTESIDKLEILLHDDVPLVSLAAARALAYIGSREPESKGQCARALANALEEVPPTVEPGLLRTLMALSGSNYGKDAEDWIEWAERLP